MMSGPKNKRGFTLIELLVVLSIISFTSSIVLSSVNSARDKARIAAGKQFEANMHHAFGANAVGIWELDEGAGTTAVDASGNGFSGSLSGSPTWVLGVNGSALRFNGSNSVVVSDLRDRVDLVGGANGKLLFSAWIRPTSYTEGAYTCFANGFSGFLDFCITRSRRIRITVDAGGIYMPVSNDTIPLEKWTHVAVLLEGGIGYKFYINGKLDADGSVPALQLINMGGLQTGIGSSETGPGNWFVGDIDSVKLYYASI